MKLFRAKSRFRYWNIETKNTQRLKHDAQHDAQEAERRLADGLRAMAPRLPACFGEKSFGFVESGNRSNMWMTYEQAADEGAHVRKGERGAMVVHTARRFHGLAKELPR